MNKKMIIAAAFSALVSTSALAQTNLQTFYDFGKDRGHFTTTLEGFYNDDWGNTFFFIDYDYNLRDRNDNVQAPSGSYMEIARCLNFWKDTALSDFSAQIEYNGLPGVNQNFLFGVDYFMHNDDFSNTFNFKLLGKTFSKGVTSDIPVQFTFVWGMQDVLGVKGLRFNGFADIWGENCVAWAEDVLSENFGKETKFVFISEPQLWYNIGQHFGIPNLHIGTEVELSMNFAGYYGFYARPCFGTKWVF